MTSICFLMISIGFDIFCSIGFLLFSISRLICSIGLLVSSIRFLTFSIGFLRRTRYHKSCSPKYMDFLAAWLGRSRLHYAPRAVRERPALIFGKLLKRTTLMLSEPRPAVFGPTA